MLHERICRALDGSDFTWEWIVVDDRSGDDTFSVLSSISARDKRVKGVRLARNAGSHVAIRCGMDQARGDCAVILASDGEDPPEMILTLVEKWRSGVKTVWGEKAAPSDKGVGFKLGAAFYYYLLRQVAGIKSIPARGADMVLIDRRVIETLKLFKEGRANVFALIGWMGF
ncbi:MAG: glycosyltransferase family 2 protein, partial [Rhodospirillales bacterium]